MNDHPDLFPDIGPKPFEGDYARVEPYEDIWQVEGRVFFCLRSANENAEALNKKRALERRLNHTND